VLIAGNGDSIFRRLMTSIGREDLARDPELGSNEGRVQRVEEIDAAIGEWTASRVAANVLSAMEEAGVPAGPIYTVADIAGDPHYRARGMIQSIQSADGLELEVPGVVPKLSATPGSLRELAPKLGQHTDEVLIGSGLTREQCDALRLEGVIA
jgi:formyl-CoA transferase